MLEKNSLEMILVVVTVVPSANVLFKKFAFVFGHPVKLYSPYYISSIRIHNTVVH
jgi:hypothetical protein